MTIYKPKTSDRKVEKAAPPSPEVVTEDVPLADKTKMKALSAQVIIINAARQRRNRMFLLMAVLLMMSLTAIGIAGGLFLYKHIRNRPYMGNCIVPYHESSGLRGTFQEQVEIDKTYGIYEKLEVPPILDSRRSTIVHDFEKNLTAIVDRDRARCFIMSLNRTTVQPPRDFLDLLVKFQSGYYVPDAEVVREKYRVATPEVENLEPFGIYIWNECHYFETYRLVRDDQPFAMSKKKRSIESGHYGKFCLGDTFTSKMTIVEIVE